MLEDGQKIQQRIDFIRERLLPKDFQDEFFENYCGESVLLGYNFSNLTIEFRLYKIDCDLYQRDQMYCFATKDRCGKLRSIVVNDIQGKEPRKGHGTIIMNKLLSYAKDHGYQEISGTIVQEDLKNSGNGLIDFYESFGGVYKVNDKQEGSFLIKLD